MTSGGGLSGAAPSSPASARMVIALIVAVAVATRIVSWWNPVPHVDDQFYLLAGEELLGGHWPYVDVWDRKPLGLFLIYAGIAAVGGGGMLAFNLVTTAFAAATAWLIRGMALRFASATSATLAALAYLLFLPLFGGQNGQSPIFYNLLMAGAASLLFAASDLPDAGAIRRRAMVAMLLCGLSMTIKQVSFVEGGYFGLAFLWLVRRQGERTVALAITAAVMVAIALLPTAVALGGYALAGPDALHEFFYANFISIFQRTSWDWKARVAGFAYFLLFLLPLLVMALLGARKRWQDGRRRAADSALLLGWLIAAILGYLSVPAFFDHYVLPLLVPICVSAATFFDRASRWPFFAAIVAYALFQGSILDLRVNRNDAREFARLSAAVDQARRGGCIYVADGPTRLYSSTGACTLTRYLFPDHLNLITEYQAVGVDTAVELALVFRERPAVIVAKDRKRGRYARSSEALLSRTLKNDYRLVYRLPDDAPSRLNGIQLWQRRDLAR